MAGLSERGKRALLSLARQTIRRRLDAAAAVPPAAPAGEAALGEERGVFVTLHRGGELRGCIGYPLPVTSLWRAVGEMALAAAFEDPRFPPLGREELDEIDIEISVLTVPRRVAGPGEVQVGRDGILVSQGTRRGLLLPQVPLEQGWDLERYLSHGCLKAGLPADAWRRGAAIETFQADVFGEKQPAEDA